MIRKLVWCLFVLLSLSGNHCSPTERDLYVFSTVGNAAQSTTDEKAFGEKYQDSDTAETNTYSDAYEGTTEFRSDDITLEDSQDDPPGPEDHQIPYSEHENPKEVPTRPDYVAPGAWAKPDPKKNIPLDFIPTKTLAQVRGTHTVKILPQSEALASATTDEERENAPRLREVVSKKKTNTIYTEEGYEDSAYDHAGHVRDADFHEGYARKLHDEHRSKARSGVRGKKKSKKRKSKNKKSPRTPEEFEEFTDDYSDEHAPSEKYQVEESSKTKKHDDAKNAHKDGWKKSDVNPKYVTENEIEKLEQDLKREAEEAEKGSENYGTGTERDIPRDHNGEDANSGNLRYTPRTRDDVETSSRPPSSEKNDNFYKENYEATTIQFERPTPGESEKYEASTSHYESPTTNKYYLPDGSAFQENYETTTFNFNQPNNPQSVVNEAPTTMNYGELFWNYYREKSNENTSPRSYVQDQTTIQQPILLRETTTLEPFTEQNPPVALATINGHGPYLLVSENGEVTQNPNAYGAEGLSYYSPNQNGHQQINPNAILDQEYGFKQGQGINSRRGESFPSFIHFNTPVNSGYGTWGFNNGEYRVQETPVIATDSPTTSYYDNIAFSSTPTYSVMSLPPKYETSQTASQKGPSYQNNPFLNSAGQTFGNLASYNPKDYDFLYKGWRNNNQNHLVRAGEQSTSGNGQNEGRSPLKSKSKGNQGGSFFGYAPNLEYSKMLEYIQSHQNGRYGGQESESANAEDFTIMKPPPLRESVFSDFTLNSYPNVTGYSSVTQESEAAQEANGKNLGTNYNGISQKDTRFKSPIFYGNNNAPVLTNRKKLFPASKLLPPSPNSQVLNYGDQNFDDRKTARYKSSGNGISQNKPNYGTRVNNFSPDSEQLARYFKNRRTPPRTARSLEEAGLSEEKIADAVIAQEINARFNFTFEDQGSTKRAERNLIPKERPSVTEHLFPLAKQVAINKNYSDPSLRDKRSHQDLLDASHKIAGDVIDEEINSRFKSKDHDAVEEDYDEEEDEEHKDEAEREKQVEVDPPDLDYLDEIQDVNDIHDIPTTTIPSIDFQKYPFYKNTKVPNSSPLKYIINPKEVPKKTFGGMEFYDSRDKYVHCEEVDPNLEEVVPDDEEPVPNRGPKENLPRLRGLGDKLDCFKAKYFGQNPFDNPLFFEKKIIQPTPPSELDPMKFATRISELPEENRNYFIPAQSRKPESVTIKRMDDSHRGTKNENLAEGSHGQSSPETRNKRRNNRDQIKEPLVEKPNTETRRTRKRKPARTLQTTTAAPPEINAVTPYQKEVYDDVMGTIKNLASLYEMYGAPTTSPLNEVTAVLPNAGRIPGASSNRNVKTSNRGKPLSSHREKDRHSSGVTETPFHEEIEGLLPPPEHNKKPKLVPYRTNKVSYNTRVRTESPVRNGDKKIIGYFRTVMVHKRSLDDHADAPIDPENKPSKHTVKKPRKKRNVIDSEFAESQGNLGTVDPSTSSAITERPKRGRRRKTSLSTTSTTTHAPVESDPRTKIENETRKPYYTIRSKSRHSKDENDTTKYGLFTATEKTSVTTDDRRNEPRYTEIMRRRGQTATTTTSTPSPQELPESHSTASTTNLEVSASPVEQAADTGEIYESENSSPRRSKVSIDDFEPTSEIYRAIASDFEPEHVEEDREHSENYEEEDEESTSKPEKITRNYDVHEDVQEDTTPSVTGFSKPKKTSEYADLESYLLTDPPGSSETFGDDLEPTASYLNADKSEDEKENYHNEESKEEEIEEDDGEHREAPKNSSYHDEESSDEDGTESPKTSESYKGSSSDNSDESGEARKNAEQDDSDDKTFFRFETRPYSPSESFEDDKYSDLGPRINKPAFYHPPFKAPKYERHYFDDSEEERDKTDESSEAEKVVFPWSHDEDDEKAEAEEGYVEQPSEKYEYPWEKRERLAEERAERRRDRKRLKKLQDFSFLDGDVDEDQDDDEKTASSSETSGKHTYPWDLYDVPSKEYKKNSQKNDNLDNDETSSEHRPVAKFSSKYSSSRFKLPFLGSEPIITAQPKEIRKSVLKYLEDAEEKSIEPTVAYETDTFTTSEPVRLTETPATVEKQESTSAPLSSGTKSNSRISNSRIIPENITIAPRKRGRTGVTHIRDRSTLRPVIRPTTETIPVAVPQTTELPIEQPKMRPSRIRGRPNSPRRQPSYKVPESQIVSSTVQPTPKLMTTSTTEEPVQSLTQSPSKYVVRKRGKSRGVSNSLKDEVQTSRQNRDDVTERATQATTTSRRRTRPTTATQVATEKTVRRNYEKSKKPSRVDTKNSLKETRYNEYRIPATSSVNSADRNVENSTPTGRTVEHRSRVSKEEIITKTSFPDQDTTYKVYKDKNTTKKVSPFNDNSDDVSVTNRKLKKTYSKTSDRARNSFGKTNKEHVHPVRSESVEEMSITTKETPEHVYEKKEILDKDGHKGMFISITPRDHTVGPSALEDELHLNNAKTEELEKQEKLGYYDFDETETQNAESNGDIGSSLPEDSFVLDYVLRQVPPRANDLKKTEDTTEKYVSPEENVTPGYEDRHNEDEGRNESEEVVKSDEESSMVNYEKDPSRRLYYYLDAKK